MIWMYFLRPPFHPLGVIYEPQQKRTFAENYRLCYFTINFCYSREGLDRLIRGRVIKSVATIRS